MKKLLIKCLSLTTLISTPAMAGMDTIFSTGFEPRFNLSGTATGVDLLGETVQLTLNDLESISVSTDGVFAFTQSVEANQPFLVTQDNNNCTLMNESGLMPHADVTNIELDCPPAFTTVYDIKQGITTGIVALQNMLVSACKGGYGYFLQTVPTDIDYDGDEHSGIFVFDNSVDCIALQAGDRVDINPATVSDFFGEIQLQNATYAVQSSNNPLPTPVISTPAELDIQGMHPLNGVVVEVQNVTVTNPDNGDLEYEVDSTLLIDDRLHTTNPYPELNESFSFIRGPLAFNFLRNKIQPRDAYDLGRPAKLVINEVDYDQVGQDQDEFIEIYNSGPGIADLTDIAIILVNGNTSEGYYTQSLASIGSLGYDEYLVLASVNVIAALPVGTASITQADSFIQNGAPDGVVLVDTNHETVIDALSYEGEITNADIGFSNPSINLVEGTATTAIDTGTGSLSRMPNGQDTDDAISDWEFTTITTPGAANIDN